MAEPGPTDRVLGGRYRLQSRLATGGMGAVWAAEDLLLGREVAVKVLGEALASDRLAALRLRREARAAGRLVHPGIARVLDLGEDGGRPYLVMELLHGESLAARLARAGPLAPAEAVRVVAAAADALEAAHRAGIVHRDVKPGNVLVTSGGNVKLLDFGIASAAGDTAVTGGGLLGTAAYLAPERVLGHQTTPAADVYALGVLLYELLAGRPPFAGDTGTALAMAHVHADPAPLRAVAPQVPPALAAACEHPLAKDPAARPPSAAAMAALLRSTVAATPTPRHPGPATAGRPTAILPPAPAFGAATIARRGALVAALVLLAALLAAVPSLGLLPLDGPGPVRPGAPTAGGGAVPADAGAAPAGEAPAAGQPSSGAATPAGGGRGMTQAGQGTTPADGGGRPGRDGDQTGEDGGGEGSDGSGGGGGGSSGPG